jgi:hypothetical protein
LRSWLAVQCAAIEDVEFGVVLWRGSTPGSLAPATSWPPGVSPGTHVIEAAEKVLKERRAAALEVSRPSAGGRQGTSTCTVLAHPIEAGRSVVGAVLLEIAPRAREEVERELRALVWGAGWLAQRAERSRSGGSKGAGFEALLDLVAVPHEHERFTAAATAFASELATRFQCSQVSLGFVEGSRVRVCAISHAAHFSAKTNLNRAREAAMEEALDQQADVLWPTPPDSAPQVVRAHEELGRLTDAGAICSLLFSHGPSFSGVATFERGPDEPFHAGEVEVLQAAANLTGPSLGLQRLEDRWIGFKARDSARRTLNRLVGPGHVALKLGASAAALLVTFLILAKGDYRVTADSVLEARVMRAAVAPFDGYLAEAPARAGDRVREGDALAVLDDRELVLEETRSISTVRPPRITTPRTCASSPPRLAKWRPSSRSRAIGSRRPKSWRHSTVWWSRATSARLWERRCSAAICYSKSPHWKTTAWWSRSTSARSTRSHWARRGASPSRPLPTRASPSSSRR